MPGAGSLKERITIQRATVSDTGNAYGEPQTTWTTLATVYAQRMDVSANEQYKAREVGAEITTRWRIRWSSAIADVNPTDRMLFDGRAYQITGVRESMRNRWLELDTVARQDVAAEETSP